MYTFATTPVPELLSVEEIVSVLRAKRSDTPKGKTLTMAGESHRFWGFLYLEQGEIHILVDGTLFHPKPGQLILYPPHCMHSVAASRDAVIDVIFFSTTSDALKYITDPVLQLSKAQQETVSQLFTLGLSLFTRAPSGLYDRGSIPRQEVTACQLKKFAVSLELFLLDLLEQGTSGSAVRPTGSNAGNYQNRQFRELTMYLKENINKALTLQQVSAACALSPAQLHRLCKKHCGCAPLAYFTALKIGAAKRLIKESSMNFTQISQELGFASVHYFSRLFKAKTGMTPSEYAGSAWQTAAKASGHK